MIWVLEKSSKANLCTSHPFGIRTSVSLEQPEKASSPIFVTEGGRVIVVRLEQPQKAASPISVTEGGRLMLARLEQSKKAFIYVIILIFVPKCFNCKHYGRRLSSLRCSDTEEYWSRIKAIRLKHNMTQDSLD